MRELYDIVDDVTNRLQRSFGIVVNAGKMKWIKPEEKALACKVLESYLNCVFITY